MELSKPGKDEGQAVGFLGDGSMVVVNGGRAYVGRRVSAEITGVLPTGGGKMVFANFVGELDAA